MSAATSPATTKPASTSTGSTTSMPTGTCSSTPTGSGTSRPKGFEDRVWHIEVDDTGAGVGRHGR